MELRIKINLDNDSFAKAPNADIELARILREFANSCEYAELFTDNGILRDANGNKVGTWEITEE